MKTFLAITAVSIVALSSPAKAVTTSTATANQRNVILVASDGLRWQEVFRGIDTSMATKENQVKNPERLISEYDAETTEARRARLMPFLWSHVASTGQIYGNRDKGSIAHVTNQMWFSYPGYNEMLTGKADDKRINSNKSIPNPNVTVFEWLAKKPEIDGKCAAFASWGVHSYIFNSGRCGFPVDAGGRPFHPPTGLTPGMEMLNYARTKVPMRWNNEAFDGLVFPMFTEYLKTQKPRASFMGLIETDAYGHEGNYEGYLDAAQRVDNFLKELWELVQSMPEYRDNTTIIFTSDHGRGDHDSSPKAWNSHNRKTPGSDAIFFAIWGPDTPALGEITSGTVTQSQTAATVARALGYDYNESRPDAALPIAASLPNIDN